MNKFRSTSPSPASINSPPTKDKPFLHLKFGCGRPPDFAANLRFAHQIAVAGAELSDTLKTDVQREGLKRYLVNNFKQGPVYDCVYERERDEGSYILLTNNWHRSAGDSKLHLSLYVYKEDRLIATWHVYTDRSLSLTADPSLRPTGTTPYETPQAVKDQRPSFTPKPSRADEEIIRPRLDRPAAAPPDSPTEAIPPVRDLPSTAVPISQQEDDDEDEEREVVSPVDEDASSRNPHQRAPPVFTSMPPSTTSRPPNTKLDPAPPSPEGWDAPPPEPETEREDEPAPAGEDWERPPSPPPEEGFERLFRGRNARKPFEEEEYNKIDEGVVDDRATSRRGRDQQPAPSSLNAPPTSLRRRRSPAPSPSPSPSPPPPSSRARQSTGKVEARSQQPILVADDDGDNDEGERFDRRRDDERIRSNEPEPDPEEVRAEREAERRRQAREAERLREEEEEEERARKREERRRQRQREEELEEEEEERKRQERRKERLRQQEREEQEWKEKQRRREERPGAATDAETDAEDRQSRRKRDDSRHRTAPLVDASESARPPARAKARRRDENDNEQAPPRPRDPPAAVLSPTSPTFRSVRRSTHHGDVDAEDDGDDGALDPDPDPSKKDRASRNRRRDSAFDPSKLDPARNVVDEDAPPIAPKTSSWFNFKGIGEIIKAQTSAAPKKEEEVEDEAEDEEEEDPEEVARRRREKEERRAARRQRRQERAERVAAATEAERTDAEDAPRIRKSKSASKLRRREGDSFEAPAPKPPRKDRDELATDAESDFERPSRRATHSVINTDVDTDVEERRRPPRRQLEKEDEERKTHSQRVRKDETDLDTDFEEPPRRGRQTTDTDSEVPPPRHRKKAAEDNRAPSTAPHQDTTEEPASAPARPPLRQRAMSFSASVDAGIRGLREAVVSTVQAATTKSTQPPPKTAGEPAVAEQEGERSNRMSRKVTRDEAEESELEPAPPSRGTHGSQRGSIAGTEQDERPSGRGLDHRRGVGADTEVDEPEDRGSYGRRSSRRPVRSQATTDGEDSDFSRPARPSQRSARGDDDSEAEGELRPRQSRRHAPSDSEKGTDNEMDKLAKANTNANSTTIPLEAVVNSKRVASPLPFGGSADHPLSVREELRRKAMLLRPPSSEPRSAASTPPTRNSLSKAFEETRVRSGPRFAADALDDSRGIGSGKRYPSPPPAERTSDEDEACPPRFSRQEPPSNTRSSRSRPSSRAADDRPGRGDDRAREDLLDGMRAESSRDQISPSSDQGRPSFDSLSAASDAFANAGRKDFFGSGRPTRATSPLPKDDSRFIRRPPAPTPAPDSDNESNRNEPSAATGRVFGSSVFGRMPSNPYERTATFDRRGPSPDNRDQDNQSRRHTGLTSTESLASSRLPVRSSFPQSSDEDDDSNADREGGRRPPPQRTTVGLGPSPTKSHHSVPSFLYTDQSSRQSERPDPPKSQNATRGRYLADTDDEIAPSSTAFPQTDEDEDEFVPKPSYSGVKDEDFVPRQGKFLGADSDDDSDEDATFRSRRSGYINTDDDDDESSSLRHLPPSSRGVPPSGNATTSHRRDPSFSRSASAYSFNESEPDSDAKSESSEEDLYKMPSRSRRSVAPASVSATDRDRDADPRRSRWSGGESTSSGRGSEQGRMPGRDGFSSSQSHPSSYGRGRPFGGGASDRGFDGISTSDDGSGGGRFGEGRRSGGAAGVFGQRGDDSTLAISASSGSSVSPAMSRRMMRRVGGM